MIIGKNLAALSTTNRKRRSSRTTQFCAGYEICEERRMLAGVLTQVGFFQTWSGLVPSTDVAGLTYHSPSGNLFLADSEINETPQFQGQNIFEVSRSGNQVFQEIASGNSEPTGIVYSEFDGFFYITNDDNDTLQRYDDNLNNPLETILTSTALASATDPEGITADPANGNLYVIDGHGGGTQVVAFDSNLEFQYSFPVSSELFDPEGIAFHPETNHLFVISDFDKLIVEYALNGAVVEQYSISSLTPWPLSLQGMTFAPTSDPLDDPGNLALFISDAGIDNDPDGGVYEVLVSSNLAPVNTAPLVHTGGYQEILLNNIPQAVQLNAAVADDGLPSPSSVVTTWSQVSGPSNVSFADPNVIDATVTFSTDGTFVLRLTADDGELVSSQDSTIVVKRGVEVRVATSADDAEERLSSGSVYLKSGDLDFGTDAGGSSSYSQVVGLRFPGMNIPQGATIVNAYVQFEADESDAVATTLTIQAQAVDDAPAFTSVNGNISSRSLTQSSVNWSPAAWTRGSDGLDERTVNISAVIQEIVSRSNWSAGNALALILGGSGERVAEPFDGNHPESAPLLHVQFTTQNSEYRVVIEESDDSTDITEGGTTDSYSVVLESPPQLGTQVTITLGTDSQANVSATSLVFDQNNWNLPQWVTVTAINDSVVESSPHVSTITHTVTSNDSNYDGILANNVDAYITDNDLIPGVTIIQSDGSTDVTEGSLSDSYDLVLDAQPQAGTTVTITIATSDGQTTTNFSSLSFNDSNWNDPQSIVVSAVDDVLVEGTPHSGLITHTVSSDDSSYDGLSIDDVNVTIADNDELQAPILFLSFAKTVSLPGNVTVENEDIVAFDGTNFSFFFDGSDVGLSSVSVDAFAVISANEILFSFRSPELIPGIAGTVNDSDLVKFTATQLGETTSGTFELFFRGSDAGLSPTDEDIDAVELLEDGRLLVSTIGAFSVAGVVGGDEDLIAFTPTIPGDYSTGTWSMYFDGSDVELSGEDVYGVAVNPNGNIHLSTSNAFSVTGISGDDEDVFTFIPTQLGNVTSGSYSSTLLFDGSLYGLAANDVNAIDLPFSTSFSTSPSGLMASRTYAASSSSLELSQGFQTTDQAASTHWVVPTGIQLPSDQDISEVSKRRMFQANLTSMNLSGDAGLVPDFDQQHDQVASFRIRVEASSATDEFFTDFVEEVDLLDPGFDKLA